MKLTNRQGRDLWKRIDTDGECWEWVGARDPQGYGKVNFGKASHLAHRVVWQLFNQAKPRCVLHRCDNPSCCRPGHLFEGTRADNNADAREKGRHIKGEKSKSSRLTEEQVREILASDEPATTLAQRYPVSNVTIGKIRRGLAWRHIR